LLVSILVVEGLDAGVAHPFSPANATTKAIASGFISFLLSIG